MDTIQPTPRNKLLGLLADAFAAADGYAQKPDSVMPGGKANPPLAMISDLVGIGALGRTLDRASYGYPLTNIGKANVPLIPADTADAALAVGPVTAAAGKVGKGVGKVASAMAEEVLTRPIAGTRAAQRGAIRVGGDPSLMPSHNTSIDSLANTISGNGTIELYSPSIGIKRGSLMHGFSSGRDGVNLIPRVGAYDPQNSVSSLFNRDVYSPRWEDYPGSIARDTKPGGHSARLEDRFNDLNQPEKLKAAEGSTPWHEDTLQRVLDALDGNYQQAVAITDSPAFRSFAQYEKSPLGAGLLKPDNSVNHAAAGLKARREAFESLPDLSNGEKHAVMLEATNGFPETTAKRRILEALSEGAEPELAQSYAENADGLLSAGHKLRQAYRKTPSEYAELKVHGPTPVNAENWAGAVVDPMLGGMDNSTEQVLSALINSGVPVATRYNAGYKLPFDHPLHPANQGVTLNSPSFEIADIMQQQAGPARKQPLRTR